MMTQAVPFSREVNNAMDVAILELSQSSSSAARGDPAQVSGALSLPSWTH